jgi:hypothetical protein
VCVGLLLALLYSNVNQAPAVAVREQKASVITRTPARNDSVLLIGIRARCVSWRGGWREVARATVILSCVTLTLLGVGSRATAEETDGTPQNLGATSYPAAYEQLLETIGVFAEARASAQTLVGRLSEDNLSVPPGVWTSFAEKISDRSTLVPLYVPIYAKHLTEADAEGLLAYYRSAPGQRWLQVQPSIQQESRAASEKWAGTIAAELLGGDARKDDSTAGGTGATDVGARLAAIRQLLTVSGSLDQSRHTMNLLIDRLQQATPASGVSGSFWDRARARITDERSLLQLWTPAYAHYLSDEDVRAMIAFYESPLGRRYVAVLPVIRSETLDAATTLANTAARRAVREVLGPLPQYRLMHPDSSEPAKTQP